MSYHEDGEELENFSGFTGGGFEAMPNLYVTNQQVGGCTTWETGFIEGKVTEIGGYLQREDVMPRARQTGERILRHLGFELSRREEEIASFVGKIACESVKYGNAR